ncbi:DNA polymerase LigD, ligase domain protein [Thermodesulfatator indicus DSM 15286]|uniref:DNA ligase (ATP) n=1 Tax=Thermodesulfatator indicus (strain DSM 15286 / JCM 11887 / CIR29812) TaxID=667014 RepID=F8AA06_THEID|nr:non-homologous end-joining DNA ligase [Thermodesulfatator indicus]AEH45292.1 DNA polymerase LigD, ligase domain protein [Thermodesulfatator indicus DSM 15286]
MLPAYIKPMLAKLSSPFDSPRFLYEIKWDGTRCLIFIENGKVRLQNRRLNDITYRYPEFWDLPKLVPGDGIIFDGEIVVLKDGRPEFRLLQEREHVKSPLKIKMLSERLPATYMAFDLLYFEGKPILDKPLRERKALLKELLPESPFVAESQYILEKGVAFFEQVVAQGFEGVMAKDLESPYLPGKRVDFWLKFKPRGKRTCVIVGYLLRPDGTLKSLLIAEPTEKGLVYRGKVASGLNTHLSAELLIRLKGLEDKKPENLKGRGFPKGARWVKPEIYCEVSFQEITNHGQFRAPVLEKVFL